MATRSRSNRAAPDAKRAPKKSDRKPTPDSPDADPFLEPEPLDELLAETPTPEPPPPLPTPPVAAPSPELAPAVVEKPSDKPAEPAAAPDPAQTHSPHAAPPLAPAPMAPTEPAPHWAPAPEPTPPHLPHFSPVLPTETPKTTKTHAGGEHLSDEEWLRIATTRRGNPELAGLGWALILLGTSLIALSYFWGITYGNLFAPLGVRGDLLGGVLLLVGLVVATIFIFVPAEHRVGLGTDASSDDLENLVRYTNGQVLLSQIMVGIGVALVMLGLMWMAYWLRAGYVDDADLRSTFGGIDMGTQMLGIPPAAIGLLVLFFFLGRLSSARRARNAAVLLWVSKRAKTPSGIGAAGILSNGVTEGQIQDLMKRLDGLMAQLPDAAVTEFSKSSEADTYLKLLGP